MSESEKIRNKPSTFQFIIETQQTEIEKTLSVWSMFNDEDLHRRPHPSDQRGRNLLEQMVHQSVSENFWFSTMLGISVTDNPLPPEETRLSFINQYADLAIRRLEQLRDKPDEWWLEIVDFFNERRSRAWIMMRRIAHTAHHRGQQTCLLRLINHDLHSTYGPTSDTGGLMQNHAPVIYPYADLESLLEEENGDRQKSGLPEVTIPVTERPG